MECKAAQYLSQILFFFCGFSSVNDRILCIIYPFSDISFSIFSLRPAKDAFIQEMEKMEVNRATSEVSEEAGTTSKHSKPGQCLWWDLWWDGVVCEHRDQQLFRCRLTSWSKPFKGQLIHYISGGQMPHNFHHWLLLQLFFVPSALVWTVRYFLVKSQTSLIRKATACLLTG